MRPPKQKLPRETRRSPRALALVAGLLPLACALGSTAGNSDGASAARVSRPALESSAAPSPELHWPIAEGVVTLITQSPTSSGMDYPCGSGVNGQHLLHHNPHGHLDAYRESLDLVTRASDGSAARHDGRGTPVVAALPGRVIAVSSSQSECSSEFGAGNYVILEHEDVLVDGKPLRSAYMHLNSQKSVEVAAGCDANPSPTDLSLPELGELVAAGQPIGEIGNTGNSTGAHLHFQFATDCTLEPANEVFCPAISVLEVSPEGFSRIAQERNHSCRSAAPQGGLAAAGYLPDGLLVTAVGMQKLAAR